jgi:dynamin 1-like protein
MEKVLAIMNELHDVFDTIGDRSNGIQLPEIVVVGSQSAGKSSVMEGIVGKDFLPRGSGVVTRRPLLIRLIHTPLNDPNRKKEYGDNDWATFKHLPDKIFTDFQEVREEIEVETDRVSGKNKGISDEQISLNIFSAKVVNLSLTDLPGITKVAVGDQPGDIEDQITKMIKSYIVNPNSLILAVTPANTDFANSDALKLAKEVDPEGERTICVLTKLDIMDKGTTAIDVLTGITIPVKLGIIGVVNRSQADIISKKSIEKCLEAEQTFLQNNYPDLAERNGIPYLADYLSELLINHIHKCLPNIKQNVAKFILRDQNTLATLGEPVSDKNATILQVISRFSKYYAAALDGSSKELESNELSCGARICYIFHDIFNREMDDINPTEGLNEKEILTTIRNAAGTRPALLIPENSFDFLVTKQLSRLEKPSIHCVDLIFEELLRVVKNCGFEMKEERKRFPRLYDRIDGILLRFLEPRVTETKAFVKKIVQVQLAYVNTKHPEFNNSELAKMLEELGKDLKEDEKETNAIHGQFWDPAIPFVPKLPDIGIEPIVKPHSTKNSAPLFEVIQTVSTTGHGNLGAQTTRQIEESQRHPLTKRERRDQMLIERLIKGYFAIIQKIIKDVIPKAIMHGIVNEVRENFRDELVKNLHKSADIDELVSESSATNDRRKWTSHRLDDLNKADMILNKIRENTI